MKPGDKVLCIDDSVRPEFVEEKNEIFLNWIKKGSEYTIRHIYGNDGIVVGVLLEEVHNFPVRIPSLGGKVQEPAFATWRFRKLNHATVESVEQKETVTA